MKRTLFSGSLVMSRRAYRLVRKLLRANRHIRYFVPDGRALWKALAQVTDLAVVAHCDDGEIGAIVPILQSFESQVVHRNGHANGSANGRRFCLIVVTTGEGCLRGGRYEDYADDEMIEARWREQKAAAMTGRYAAVIQLGRTSDEVQDLGHSRAIVRELSTLFTAVQPDRVFTHVLSDRHGTHVAVALRTIAACKALGRDAPLNSLFGCEVWGGLDWCPPGYRMVADITGWSHLASALVGLYDSQINPGKDYLSATQGIRLWHAHVQESHEGSEAHEAVVMMDMTNLLLRADLDPAAFMEGAMQEFAEGVIERIRRLTRARDRIEKVHVQAPVAEPQFVVSGDVATALESPLSGQI